MKKKLAQFVEIIRQDPAVAKVAGFSGGGTYGWGLVVLKRRPERLLSAEELANRLLLPAWLAMWLPNIVLGAWGVLWTLDACELRGQRPARPGRGALAAA